MNFRTGRVVRILETWGLARFLELGSLLEPKFWRGEKLAASAWRSGKQVVVAELWFPSCAERAVVSETRFRCLGLGVLLSESWLSRLGFRAPLSESRIPRPAFGVLASEVAAAASQRTA